MLLQEQIYNFVEGEWVSPDASDYLDVLNPATEEVLAQTPLSGMGAVEAAVKAAQDAFPNWRRTPAQERIQYLFRLRVLLEQNLKEMARTLSLENGKTFSEAQAELQRGIENVEVACGIPTLMQGYNLEDIAHGIDEIMIRQPMGVVAAITPFNFPGMIPLWFLPYAVACGNTFILKPSERVPLTARFIYRLVAEAGFPPGVLNLVNGGRAAVDAILDHPKIRAISFVGSTPVARYVYSRGSANGKRVQCQGGAKNHAVIMPDADQSLATRVVSDSAFGCAGQRCLAVSVAITVGSAQRNFADGIVSAASAITVGPGLSEGVKMGPVISKESETRIEDSISRGSVGGAKVILDGRRASNKKTGYFVAPTILDGVEPGTELASTEIFGPVLSLIHANSIDQAIEIISSGTYGNASSIFTTSGSAARKFRYEVPTGNVGVNVGTAAPMAYFPFSGWKDSFMGVMHGQGRDAVEFYTDKKVVIERWPKEL